jgi:hypothetical protein
VRAQFPAWKLPANGRFPPASLRTPAAAASLAARRQLFDNDNDDVEAGGVAGVQAAAACGVCGCSCEAQAEAAAPGVGSDAEAGEEAAEEEDDDRRCSICLERFSGGQLMRTLPCSHTFHMSCIDAWLTISSRCCPEDGLPVMPHLEEDDDPSAAPTAAANL